MKAQRMISIDMELNEKIKEMRLPVSAICEEALRVRSKMSINEPEDKRVCHYCHKEDLNMIWDGYLEIWVCSQCNKTEIKRVSILARY